MHRKLLTICVSPVMFHERQSEVSSALLCSKSWQLSPCISPWPSNQWCIFFWMVAVIGERHRGWIKPQADVHSMNSIRQQIIQDPRLPSDKWQPVLNPVTKLKSSPASTQVAVLFIATAVFIATFMPFSHLSIKSLCSPKLCENSCTLGLVWWQPSEKLVHFDKAFQTLIWYTFSIKSTILAIHW